MFEVGSIIAKVKADTTDFKEKMNQVEKQTKGVGEKMTDASKKMALGLVAIGAAAGVFAKKSIDAYNIQAEAEAQLMQLHMNRKGVTEDNVKELFALASATQAVGVIGDEAIIKGQAQLATFQLSTDAIKKLTPAMADMVAQQKGVNATGGDFVNVGNLMGKVMEGQIGALGRYGVSFSDAQREILETGNETERAATLAEVLAQNYGGVNEALRETFQGQMQAAKNTMGDFMELIGQLIVDFLMPVIQRFNEWANAMGGPEGMLKRLNEFVDKHGDKIKAVSIGIGVMLIPALISWAIAAGAAAIATIAATWPLLLLGAAAAAMAYIIIKNWDWIMDKTEDFRAFIRKIFEWIYNFLVGGSIIPDLVNKVMNLFTKMWTNLRNAFSAGLEFIKDTANKIKDAILSPFTAAREAAENAMNKIRDVLDFTKRQSPSVLDIVESGVDKVNKIYEGLKMPSLSSPTADFSTSGSIVNPSVTVNLDGAIIGSLRDADLLGEKIGDSIIKKLQTNVRF